MVFWGDYQKIYLTAINGTYISIFPPDKWCESGPMRTQKGGQNESIQNSSFRHENSNGIEQILVVS